MVKAQSVAGFQFGEAVSEEVPLGIGLREVQRPLVGVASLAVAAGAAEQVGVGRVEVAVVAEFEGVEYGQSGPGSVDRSGNESSVNLPGVPLARRFHDDW